MSGRLELPEPRGYRWLLDTGEVRFNDDAADPPCDAYEEWSVCAALYDTDQLREAVSKAEDEVRATVAEYERLLAVASGALYIMYLSGNLGAGKIYNEIIDVLGSGAVRAAGEQS